MKVLVIGGGGREHALAWKIAESPLVKEVYCAPGNPGTARIAENVPIGVLEFDQLIQFAHKKKIDLTVVGPEDPLVNGIVDTFRSHDLKIFGPDKNAARLEGSKIFAKDLMKKYDIPTAEYQTFHSADQALVFLQKREKYPVVLKADGLAAGKGVLICHSLSEAVAGVSKIMEDRAFGSAGDEVVIEDFLQGEEVSIFAICNGLDYLILSPSQDHKKALDGDQGKNTGGMGAYAPAPIATDNFLTEVKQKIIEPTLQALVNEGMPYKGLLYFGLIQSGEGPKVLEYNCRFGDPETEVVLPLLKSDLVPLLIASADGTLGGSEITFHGGFALDVVLASGGYPDQYEKGKAINGLDTVDGDILIFHAGTKTADGCLVTNGGRVLNVVAMGEKLPQVRDHLYENIKKIQFHNMHYRRDIGFRALQRLVQ